MKGSSRNKFLIVFGLFAMLVTNALGPNLEGSYVPPSQTEFTTDKSLPLPPIGPRDTGFDPFDSGFLFQLADTDKMSGEARERILHTHYREIVSELSGDPPPVTIERVSGMTVVSIAGEPFATVLQADAPEYYKDLDSERK